MSESSGAITAIVMAAGQSTRMGKTNKLLAKVNGKTLLQLVLINLQQSSVNEIVVVTGYDSEKVQDSIVDFDIKLVNNADYKKGLSSSIKTGIENLSDKADAALICHGDMPFIMANTLDRIANAFCDQKNIIMPTFMGQGGNPLLWPRCYFDILLNLRGDSGAKQVLAECQQQVVHLNVENVGIVLDIDELPTLEYIQSRFDFNLEDNHAS